MGSSQSGPSRVAHWKPWMMLSFTMLSSPLSTSEGRVSSTKMLGPVASGPKAQMERAARRSQSYFVWKNSPRRLRFHVICTTSLSMSSARPFSSGSAIMVILFFLFGVSAKHLREDVSTTVSQKQTTGSATLMSISEYIFLRSCMTQSR
uniref:Uncharacterized protein n=1 Tax=Ixodes ricinus TaxID=34613 RepID=A0A6B0UUZ3_IXORI